MLFFFLRVGSILKTAGSSRHYSLHIRERMFRSPLVLTYLASETCARVLKANWKLFPGTTPHSMPFDTWIIFLKFWRNLASPPLLCFFGAELLPVFPHSCPSERRNHKNAAKQSLSIELQFHLRSLKCSPASSEFTAVSGVLECPALLPADGAPLSTSRLATGLPRAISAIIGKATNEEHTGKFNIHIQLTDIPT